MDYITTIEMSKIWGISSRRIFLLCSQGRVQQNMTQKDLSAKTGITQADISRIENGTRNPSLSMVKKLAQGLGMQLKLEFVPMPTKNKM